MENINPHIGPTDYFKQYNESIQKLKNSPELITLDKLIYDVFEVNKTGRELLEVLEKRFVYPKLTGIESPNYQLSVIYTEGFKEAIRMFRNSITSHKQRISAEVNKA